MNKAGSIKRNLMVALGIGVGIGLLAPVGALGQVTRERDVTITGPRGKTIQRDFKSTITPGGIDRSTTITRPGGTFTRNVQVNRPGPAFGPGPGFRPGWGPGPRPIIINGGGGGIGPGASFGLGALAGTAGGLLVGSALAAPRPPVVVAPAPVVIAGGPAVVQGAPVQTVVAQPVAVDMVPQEIARLSSVFPGTRREAAGILGRMHDSRAVPALVERLKNDSDKSVRITAAHALADVGDPSAAVYLERSSIYDHKQEVRNASLAALARLPKLVIQPTEVQTATRVAGPGLRSNVNPGPASSVTVPPPPTPASGERR
jgi:HEAT repeats